MKKKPFVLIILDGFGCSDKKPHNPIQNVATPTLDYLFQHYPHLSIEASGEAVGLPKNQMGNSEVGHLHIGAGRKVPQDLTRINHEVENGLFFENAALKEAIHTAKKNNAAIHTIALWSDGGVHSNDDHIAALLKMIDDHGVKKNYFHAIADGRDTAPKSISFEKIQHGKIASLVGRYYAMDRDKRWDRTQKAYDLYTSGDADFTAHSAMEALEKAYHRGESDEFILPTAILENQKPITIHDNDVIIFMNFRADRMRQLVCAFTDKNFNAFSRKKIISLSDVATLTEYDETFSVSLAYPPLVLKNTLGEIIAKNKLNQLRLAETEKYAHVTYFLNGGVETPNENEKRLLIASPKVATYDLQPEMSAIALTDALVDAILTQETDVIICNYANPDMVGHTGNEKAAEKAVLVIDACLSRVLDALKKAGGEALITADHGNIEKMFDEKTGQPHTAHTTNLVPLIYVGRPASTAQKTGALDDVAPTLLYLMGIEKPSEMTGKTLFHIS